MIGNILLNICRAAGGLSFGFRQRLAVDYADDLVDPGSNAAIEISLLEARRNDLADDALAGGVIERSFQAVPHLDAQRAVVLGDDQDRTVIDFLAPQLPLLRNAQGILLDRFRSGGGNNENRELTAFPGFKRLQGLLQGCLLLCGERGGLVGDAPGQGRDRDLCSSYERPAKRECKQ